MRRRSRSSEPNGKTEYVGFSSIARTIRAVRDLGKTVLLVEQNAHLALELADRAYVMQNGTTVAEGRAEELKRQEMMNHFYIGLEREGAQPLRQRAPAMAQDGGISSHG